MYNIDFANPGFMEYMLVLITALLIFLLVGSICYANHLRTAQANAIINSIKARGPVATISIQVDGTVTTVQHKTPEDIRRDIAEEYNVPLDKVRDNGNGSYTLYPQC